MALNLTLSPLTVPFGTEFPGTVQSHLQLISEYLEINGGENFETLVYGSSTPAEADRGKAWFKTNESGKFLGWHYWDGAAWSLGPSYIKTGNTTQRNAISAEEGYPFYVTGSGLYIYTAGTWQRSVPETSQQSYDRHYFFPAHQALVATDQTNIGWQDIDLSPYISDAGLQVSQIKAAIIRIRGQLGPIGFRTLTSDLSIKVSNSDNISTASTDIPMLYILVTADDSNAAGANDYEGFLPMVGSSEIYWCATSTNPIGPQAYIYLVGFVYT